VLKCTPTKIKIQISKRVICDPHLEYQRKIGKNFF